LAMQRQSVDPPCVKNCIKLLTVSNAGIDSTHMMVEVWALPFYSAVLLYKVPASGEVDRRQHRQSERSAYTMPTVLRVSLLRVSE